MKVGLFLLIILTTTFPYFVRSANILDVVINEISWMGTTASYNDEWIELYNNTPDPINIDGWVLKSEDGGLEIKLAGTISGAGFYLLERTDNNAIPNIPADLIYKGALGNNGENLKIIDNNVELIDEVNAASGWFAGNNETKQTMERKNPKKSGSEPSNWQTSENTEGTPKLKNSAVLRESEPPLVPSPTVHSLKPTATSIPAAQTQTPMPTPTIPATPLAVKNYPKGIVINEILPSPEGSDETEEWIEIFNQNNFEVDLSDWQISDKQGSITTHTFPQNTKITNLGYLILKRPESKITLNNTGDELILLNPAGEILDSAIFDKAPAGESYNRLGSNWFWSKSLTPGKQNQTPEYAKTEEKEKNNATSDELQETNPLFKEGTAALAQKIKNAPNQYLPILGAALITSIISAGALLFLKRSIKKVD